jgi:hypothetical protein
MALLSSPASRPGPELPPPLAAGATPVSQSDRDEPHAALFIECRGLGYWRSRAPVWRNGLSSEGTQWECAAQCAADGHPSSPWI